MKTYRIKLKCLSSLASFIGSDTIFGAFCWAYVYKHGKDGLEAFLEKYRDGNPPLVFSNAFPRGFLPRPLSNLPYSHEDTEDRKSRLVRYKTYSRVKKQEFIPLEKFRTILEGTRQDDYKEWKDHDFSSPYTYSVIYRNSISRNTGHTLETGGLFSKDEIYAEKGLDVYVRSEGWDGKEIEEIFEIMGFMGLGGNKSVGKGSFEVEALEEFSGFEQRDSDSFVVLSNYIPRANDPTDGNYRTIMKYGKLDREYSQSQNPFKKPLVMIKPGSVFKTDKVKDYYGRVVENVSPLFKETVHNGIAFVVGGKGLLG